jgi:DNA (cytosine-5)-methyltransferase 1
MMGMSSTARAKGEYGVKLVRGPFLSLPPHPLAVDTEADLDRILPQLEGPLAADLFCGAGGLSLGLEAAGYQVVVGVDHDEKALETHRAYHPGLSQNLDLADLAVVERLGELLGRLNVELVAGGPPCQPFSKAGRSGMRDLVRRGVRPRKDMRRELWQSFLRVIAIARPPAVLMENVPDMALDRGMWILRTLVDELEQLGYAVEERVLSTGDYGVPQFRHRLFVVALRDGISFSWPEPTGQIVTVRNAIGDLPAVDGGWRPTNGDNPADPVASGWTEYPGPKSTFQRAMRVGMPRDHTKRVYDHITRPVREDDALAFEGMHSGTRYSELPEELQRYRSDIFDDKYKRLDWNTLSRTIVAHIAKDGYWYIHPDQPRTLTIREAARLQTFPDRIRFAGPPTAAFTQIGNAVPPQMGSLLGTAIRDSLARASREEFTTAEVAESLATWFEHRKSLTVPWLRSQTRWQVICAETMFLRLSASETHQAWKILEQLPDPAATEVNLELLSLGARALGRSQRVDVIQEMLGWISTHPTAVGLNASFTEIREVPGIAPGVADMAVRVHPGSGDDRDEPVLATTPVLRVASRFLGGHVENNRNRLSDGRLAVARMIGGDDNSHQAHLALFELAASHCSSGSPECGPCPLVNRCAFAADNGFQPMLPVTSRAG